MRVSHFKYGAGTVTAVKENNKIFCVNFDKFGVKEFSTLLCAVLGAFKVLCPTGSNNEEQKWKGLLKLSTDTLKEEAYFSRRTSKRKSKVYCANANFENKT